MTAAVTYASQGVTNVPTQGTIMGITGPPDDAATKEDIRRLWDKIDTLTDDLNKRFVTEARLAAVALTSAAELQSIRENMRRLDDWQTWAMRIILGAVLIALVGVVLVGPAK